MIATLPFNPRLLATPDDMAPGPELGRWLAAANMHGAWAIALDGLSHQAIRDLKRAETAGARVLVPPSGRPCQVMVCIRWGQDHEALDYIKALSDETRQIADALAATIDADERTRWTLRCGRRELAVGTRTLLMGIVNVTPDSFSDAGQFLDASAAIEHGRRLAGEGADLLDVGGESTRPGAQAIDAEGECQRVLPVIEALAGELEVPISIDTSKAAVARAAVEAGATILNDVTALRGDPDMAAVAADERLPVVLMHMQGSPRTMQKQPHYDDLMAEIVAYLRRSMALAVQAGVPEDQLVVDPGIGFGKTVEQNLQIVAELPQLRSLGQPILLGTSRKSFIGAITGADVTDRLFGTAATVAVGISRGAHIVRVHDVAQMRRVAQMTDALLLR